MLVMVLQALNKNGPMVADNKFSYLKTAYYLPFRTNSAKYQSIWTYLGALSAISVFLSLNKLGPLVVNFKIGFMNSAYTLQDKLSQISANLDRYGSSKCHFCVSVTK